MNDKGNAEVDFVLDNGSDVIPVEVKVEVNLQAKSTNAYRDKFHPRRSIRTCMAQYKDECRLLSLPRWAVETINKQ